jgi:hypothetical protein
MREGNQLTLVEKGSGLLLPAQEETEIIEGEVVEIEIDRPEAGNVSKTVSWVGCAWLAERMNGSGDLVMLILRASSL